MQKIQLDIVALSHSVTQTNNFAVVLGEQDGQRRLPIVIGSFEAQAIAVALERMHPNRPLTHDLFKNTLETFDIQLQEVIISNLLDGIFHAKLVCMKDGQILEIDSRTSDAIALAVRFECPIYTYEFVLDTAGVAIEDPEGADTEQKKSYKPKSITQLSDADLQKRLEEVLEKEDYETAAKIRDEIKRREQEQ